MYFKWLGDFDRSVQSVKCVSAAWMPTWPWR